jgi:hypothetical protein
VSRKDPRLCAAQVHERVGPGPCAKCQQGQGKVCRGPGRHDLTREGATDRRGRCAACKAEGEDRRKAKQRKEKAAAGQPSAEAKPRWVRGPLGPAGALYRLALMNRGEDVTSDEPEHTDAFMGTASDYTVNRRY